MKTIKIIFSLIALIVLIGLVNAQTRETNNGFYGIINDDGSYTKTQNPINNFNAIGFVCGNDDCSNVIGTLWNGEVQNSGDDNQMILNYPTTLQGKGYGVFFYKEGYFPFEALIDYYGTQSKIADNYFTRKQNCQVPINDLVISHYGNKVVVNVTLSSDVSSPVQHAGPLNYVPDSIKHLYAVDANVTFSFVGPQNLTIVKEANLPASESRRISASYDNLKAGEYQLIVESNANDVKCINSIPLRAYSNLLIEDNRTNVTLPTIAILNPESKTYNTKNIQINLRSTNATSVFYNWNGVNISYNGPVYVTFNEGQNTLTAYGVNEVTTARASVTFYVDTSGNNNQTNDTIPPATVSNLHLVSKDKYSIEWAWDNPSDADFQQNIIYINGVIVAYTSNNFYRATGLFASSDYTLLIKTQDFSNNINHNGVSDTQRTLSNGGSNNNDDSNNHVAKKKILKDLGPRDQINQTSQPFVEDEIETLEVVKSKGYDVSKLFILLFVIGIILLILLIIALLMVR